MVSKHFTNPIKNHTRVLNRAASGITYRDAASTSSPKESFGQPEMRLRRVIYSNHFTNIYEKSQTRFQQTSILPSLHFGRQASIQHLATSIRFILRFSGFNLFVSKTGKYRVT
jgi:hypothetical protein